MTRSLPWQKGTGGFGPMIASCQQQLKIISDAAIIVPPFKKG
jgi:hypothetical protein